MTITGIQVRPVERCGQFKGVASVTFDDMFVVHDVKVIDGPNGLFVAMPNRRKKSGEFTDIAHPINQAARAMIEDAVIEAYDGALRGAQDAQFS